MGLESYIDCYQLIREKEQRRITPIVVRALASYTVDGLHPQIQSRIRTYSLNTALEKNPLKNTEYVRDIFTVLADKERDLFFKKKAPLFEKIDSLLQVIGSFSPAMGIEWKKHRVFPINEE